MMQTVQHITPLTVLLIVSLTVPLQGSCSVFQLVRSAVKMQPALLPALFLQHGKDFQAAGDSAAAPALGTAAPPSAPRAAQAAIKFVAAPVLPWTSIPTVLLGLLPGVVLKAEDVQRLVQMMLLDDSRALALSSDAFVAAVTSSMDASKRAYAIFRMVGARVGRGQ